MADDKTRFESDVESLGKSSSQLASTISEFLMHPITGVVVKANNVEREFKLLEARVKKLEEAPAVETSVKASSKLMWCAVISAVAAVAAVIVAIKALPAHP